MSMELARRPVTGGAGAAATRGGRSRTILFCREVPWNTELPVSTRKLAERFADAGWRVVWLTPPRPPWRGAAPRAVHSDAAPNVTELAPRTLLPFSLRVPGVWRLMVGQSWAGCVPPLKQALARAGLGSPDVLWLSHLSALGLPRVFPGAAVLWQVTDDYPLLSRTERRCRTLLRWNLSRADAVLFSSPLLLERYGALCRRARREPSVLPHGVDEWRLRAEPLSPDPLLPARGPRVVYVGNTQRADVELLCGLAQTCDVVVVGDPSPFAAQAPGLPRLQLLGKRPPEYVGRLLAGCDLGLVCYSPLQLRAAAEGGNPMKAYEYAAAGLPILAPRLPVFARLGVPVSYYEDLPSLREQVRLLSSRGQTARAEMRAWAAEHTWERRFLAVEQLVSGLLPASST